MTVHEDWLSIKEKVSNIQKDIDRCHVSNNLVAMLIVAEDHRFYRHFGVDLISVFRAIWRGVYLKKGEGASTIEMQLVRVLTGHYERTFKRKFFEMYLAVRLTMHLNKTEIPKIYLFVAYFGWGMNGLLQASRRMDIDLMNINNFDAASLIARLKYPEPKNYNKARKDKILARTEHILKKYIEYYT